MATKKITELPLINTISGSTAIPIVIGGTTDQVSIENLSKFATAYSATTASNHFIGNQTITGDVNVSGKITAEEYHTTITSASVIYQSGSTKFGDDSGDTHTFLGTLTLNGQPLGTGQLNSQTSSQALINTVMSYVTASMNVQSSSQDLVNRGISSVTGSINTTTSSFNSVFARISSVTGSMNVQSSSQDLVNRRISSTTGSINTTTASFDSVFFGISSVTGAINTQSSSQDLVNLGISTFTGSLRNEINAIEAWTASLDSTYATDAQLYQLYQATASVHFTTQSLNTQTGSQDLVNLGISTYTGSNESWKDGVRGEVSAIEAWTASLDSTYATDAQLYQLYQATASIHSFTSSLRSELNLIEALTASMKAAAIISSSQQISNLGFATTSSVLGSGLISSSQQISNFGFPTTSSQDTLSNKTLSNPLIGSFNITSDGLSRVGTYGNNVEIFSKDGLLINPTTDRAVYIDAYDNNNKVVINSDLASYETNSKGIVSSSQQIKDYITFVNNDVTSSMSVYSASFAAKVWTPSGTANQFLYQSAGGASSNTTSTGNVTYDSGNTSLNVSNLAIASTGTLASSLDRSNNISLHDGSFGTIAIRNGGVDKITINRNNVGGEILLSGSIRIDGPFVASNGVVSGSSQLPQIATLQNSSASMAAAIVPNSTNATIVGNLTINQNLTVLGSSSIQYVSSSQVNIGTNNIILNTNTPSVRFAGLSVHDSGSGDNVTGSLWWDSTNNGWIYQHEVGGTYSGGALISGPKNTGALGSEVGLTTNYLQKAQAYDHITQSAIYDDGTFVGIQSNTQITGSATITNSANAYLYVNAPNAGGNEAGTYYQIGGVNKWEEYTAANDGNMNWYSQGNGIQFKIYPTQGASFTGPVSASSALFNSSVDSGGVAPVIRNYTDVGGDNTRYAGINFMIGSDNGTASIRAFRTNSASDYSTALTFWTKGSGAGATSPTEKVRITNDGKLGVGTVTPVMNLQLGDVFGFIQDANSGYVDVNRNSNGTYIKSQYAARIHLDSAIGCINFLTAPTGTAAAALSFTEKMKLSNTGDLGIGLAGGSPSQRLDVQADRCANFVAQIINQNTGDCGDSGVLILQGGTYNSSGDTTSRYLSFRRGDGTQIGAVRRNGASNVAYDSSSDYRLKEDLKDFNGLDKISAIKVYDFQWKNTTERMEGVMAHELQEVVPYAVGGEKDGIDVDGNMIIQGVDYSKLVPILIKSVQEQQAIIEELKARLIVLESK